MLGLISKILFLADYFSILHEKKEHTMKNFLKTTGIFCLTLLVSQLNAEYFRSYKMGLAHNKMRAIELLAKDTRSASEEAELDRLCHNWAQREMDAYKINRMNSSMSLLDYKKELAVQKARAIELAAQEKRTPAEQKELRDLGHAWALREKAVFRSMHKKTKHPRMKHFMHKISHRHTEE